MTRWDIYTAARQASPKFGGPTNYLQISESGVVTLHGAATVYDDLLRDATSARNGAVAPTIGAGFRGDANHIYTTFVHSQADEVQFEVQLPHRGAAGTAMYPHVHFMPTTTGTGTVKFILEYYAANPGAQFPSSPATYPMTKTWEANQQWYHLLATGASGLTLSGWELSNVWHVRLYRDNTVDGNYAAAVGFLYFDIHVEIDSFGSDEEYSK